MRLSIALLCVPSLAFADLLSWDWQLSSSFDLSQDVDAIDLDPDEVTLAQMTDVATRVPLRICYVSVGTLEDWRDDMSAFPAVVIGRQYDEWPDEKFLDVRRRDVLVPIMRKRFEACKALGFNAIEPDNMDAHDNDSGFPLSQTDMMQYVRALADMAHSMDMLIGQKNVPEMTADLSPHLDFVVTESCLRDGWCGDLEAYIAAGKPIFSVEYGVSAADYADNCAFAKTYGMSLIFKDDDLHAGGARCR